MSSASQSATSKRGMLISLRQWLDRTFSELKDCRGSSRVNLDRLTDVESRLRNEIDLRLEKGDDTPCSDKDPVAVLMVEYAGQLEEIDRYLELQIKIQSVEEKLQRCLVGLAQQLEAAEKPPPSYIS